MDVNNIQLYDGQNGHAGILTPELGANMHPLSSKDHSSRGTASMGETSEDMTSGKMKFKKKSHIDKGNLNNILESKARISINTKTGKYEFTYQNQSSNYK